MTDNESNNDSTSTTPEPEAAKVQQFGMQDRLAYQGYERKTNKVLWGVFVLLIVLTVGVFFILPKYVQTPDASSRIVVVEAGSDGAPLNSISPFEEAQRLRQRSAAQDTLARLLELQEALENKEVQLWAKDSFAAAIDLAKSGDTAYREQDFIGANTLYQQGVDGLQDIIDNEDSIYLTLVEQGAQALSAGNAQVASNAFTLALLVSPIGGEAQNGLDRAAVLDEVLGHLIAGQALHESKDLEAAQQEYRQARALDAKHLEVNAALSQVARDIEQRDFSAAMSRGYAALQNNDPQSAELAFKQAEKIRPQASEIQSALQQTADKKTMLIINQHIELANISEAEENWQAALKAWESALLVDPNLVLAGQGVQRAQNRRDLDVFFNTVIQEPLRLVDETIYQQTEQLLTDIKQLSEQGPRLRQQLTQVQALMSQAKEPKTVQIKSDGFTEVNLLRVKTLGRINSTSMELPPGNYVALGVRTGYRDVRVEFTIDIGGQAPVVTVICQETI